MKRYFFWIIFVKKNCDENIFSPFEFLKLSQKAEIPRKLITTCPIYGNYFLKSRMRFFFIITKGVHQIAYIGTLPFHKVKLIYRY